MFSSQQSRINIGILGGTFNPIHKGHIKIAKLARKKFNLHKIFFVVANVPPHKPDNNILDSKHRFNMVKLAIKNTKNFFASNFEIKKKNISYSYYTIKYFRKRFPKAKLFYIIGQDELNILPTWHKIYKILKLTDFIVVNRANIKSKIHNSSFIIHNSLKIHPLKIKPINISSTHIRQFIWRKRSVWQYLPAPVSMYIKKHLLYL